METEARALWIGDVFSKERFDALTPQQLDLLFEEPSEFADLATRSNHFLLGAKGSGKSTLLRSLSLSLQGTRGTEPQFAGVYLGLSHDTLSLLRSAASDNGNPALFEHFLMLSILSEIGKQWTPQNVEAISTDFRGIDLVASFLQRTHSTQTLAEELAQDRTRCMDMAKNLRGSEIDFSVMNIKEQFSISSITRFAEFSSPFLSEWVTGGRFGLLIDSLDHYRELTPLLFVLFESDSTSSITVKAAARSIDLPELFANASSRPLELHRDFELLSLDRAADSEEYFALVKRAVLRRCRVLGPQVLDEESDNHILDLLFGDSDQETLYGKLLPFVSSTSGNILNAIVLLGAASRMDQRLHNAAGVPISPMTALSESSRDAAVRNQSREYWQYEIGSIAQQLTADVRCICEILLPVNSEDGDSTRYSPRFELTEIPEEHIRLVRRLIRERLFLGLDTKSLELIQAGYGELTGFKFELNRSLFADKRYMPSRDGSVDIDWGELWFKAQSRLDEKHYRRSGKHRAGAPTLFGSDPPVFISRPLAKKIRVQVVKNALERSYKLRLGRAPLMGEAWIDIDTMPNAGRFRQLINEKIILSHYVIADITDGSADVRGSGGVFFEVGLAVSLGKVVGLFHNARAGEHKVSLDQHLLPPSLMAQTILNYGSANGPFRIRFDPWNDALRHDASERSNSPTSPPVLGDYVYLSIQPHNAAIEQIARNEVAKMFPKFAIRTPRDAVDDLHQLSSLIANAKVRIVDASFGVSSACLELGLAAYETGNPEHSERTLMIYDASQDAINPVPMYPGIKIAWRYIGDDDKRQLVRFLYTVGRLEIQK